MDGKRIKWNEVLFIFADGKKGFYEFLDALRKNIPLIDGRADDEGFVCTTEFEQGDKTALALTIQQFAKKGKFNLYLYPSFNERFVCHVIARILGIENGERLANNYYVATCRYRKSRLKPIE